MNEILIDDIRNSEKDILKFISSPKEFLKNYININFHKIINRENLISENKNKIEDMKLEYNNKIDIIFENNLNIPLLFPEKKICSINYDQINLDSSYLSIPIIANVNGEIKSNCKMINVQVTTPFLNHFYSEPIILNIMSYVEEDIKAEIKELSYNHKEEFEKKSPKIEFSEKINEIRIEDIHKYVKAKTYTKAREPIRVKIYIPNIINELEKKDIQNQKIGFLLKLIIGGTKNLEIPIEIKILRVSIKILFSCNNYKLEFFKGNFYLKTNKLYPEEKLIFNINNYIKVIDIIDKTMVEPLEGNQAEKPDIYLEENKMLVKIPKVNNIKAKRLNYKIDCYINSKFKIPIIIDSAIIPYSHYSFQIYDFFTHSFTSNQIKILLPPISFKEKDFYKKDNFYSLKINFPFDINFHCYTLF